MHWDDQAYDAQLTERTLDLCNGNLDIILDFEAAPKFFRRSLNCLKEV